MAKTTTSPFFSRPDIVADYGAYCAEQGLKAGQTASAQSYLSFVKKQLSLQGKELRDAAAALAGAASAYQSQRHGQLEGDRVGHNYTSIHG
jgi:hypothetical protein